MSRTVLPNLRKFLVDNDKVLAACTNIIYYIVAPAIKVKSKPLDVDNGILDIIAQMSQIPSALKAWRGIVWDIINDGRFFQCMLEGEGPFRPIVQAWVGCDKTAFSEVLGRAFHLHQNIVTHRHSQLRYLQHPPPISLRIANTRIWFAPSASEDYPILSYVARKISSSHPSQPFRRNSLTSFATLRLRPFRPKCICACAYYFVASVHTTSSASGPLSSPNWYVYFSINCENWANQPFRIL